MNDLLGDVRTDNQPTFSAQDHHNCIDKKTADIRAATASATPPTFSECYTSRLNNFEMVDAEKVVSFIKAAPSKQCLLDPLPKWLLKDCASLLAPYITVIINSTLTVGSFPIPWKHAIVSHLLKKAGLDVSLPTNYRPISNLSFLSKLLERVICKQTTDYLIEHKLLEIQSAYRRGHSTETAVLKVFSDIIDAIKKGQLSLLSLLDLSAAFDTVDHSIMRL